jgi:predicted dinucleotide-binding enzyme
MNIGIIGTGNMGRSLGRGWSRAGHSVLFGSRDVSKAKTVAADSGGSLQAGTLDEAASFGDVVLYTVPNVFPSRVLKEPGTLSGKILIDCNNSAILGLDVPDPAGRAGVHFTTPVPSLAEQIAANVPAAHVVKAFNTIPATVIQLGREKLAAHRVSVFLCGDDVQAKSTVNGLVEDLGFVGVDSGDLERAQMVEAVADFIRFQILDMRLGPFATISVTVLKGQ